MPPSFRGRLDRDCASDRSLHLKEDDKKTTPDEREDITGSPIKITIFSAVKQYHFKMESFHNRRLHAKNDRKQNLSPVRMLVFAGVAAIFISLTKSTRMSMAISEVISENLRLGTVVDDSPHGTTIVGMGASSPKGHLSLSEITQNPPLGSLECPPMTSPVYDRVVEDKGSNKIPKIIHVSFISRCVPTDVFAEGIQRWKDELPDYSVYFHDDNAIDRFMQQHWEEFPDLHRVMKCMKYNGAMKVDLWRMLITYEFGGIYTDIDNIPAKEFRNGTAILPDDTFFASSDSWNRPVQNVFAMEPEHPIAVFTVQIILRNVMDLQSLRSPNLVFVTGPDAFKAGYLTYFKGSGPKLKRQENWKWLDPGIHKGFMNKSVHKTKEWNWLNPFGGDTVEYGGFNMSKKERAIRIGGTIHWRKEITKNNGKQDFSCKEYLYRLDHPTGDDRNAANWTLIQGPLKRYVGSRG